MTVTTPEIGLRARVLRLTRRTAVFAIALGICGLVAPGTAIGATDDSTTKDDGTVELYVSAGARGAVAPGGSTSAIVTVHNETDSPLSSGRVLVELNRTPLTDDDAVTGWLDDGDASGDFTALGSEATTSVDAGDEETTTVFVPDDVLGDLAPGIYPLRAALSGASTGTPGSDEQIDHDAAATSVMVVTAGQTAQIGVLVPITATPAGGALLTSEELSTLTAEDGALTAQLDGVVGTAAILAIDPAIMASIRVLGTAAPASATEWLTRLDELPNERFALQFGDADATAQAHAQLPSLLQPTTLAPFLDERNFPKEPAAPITDAPGTTATPSPAATDSPVFPDDAALSEVEGASSGVLWPRGDVTQDDLATFAEYLGRAPLTILPSGSVGGAVSAHATAGSSGLLVTDDAASAVLSQAAAEKDPAARQRALAAANAHLYLAAQKSPTAPLLIGLERDETRSADALRDAISTADTAGFSLTDLRATPAAAVTLTAEPDESRAVAVNELLVDESTLTGFSSILADPQVLLSPERIRILRTLAVGIPTTAFGAEVLAHRDATRDTLNAVSIPPSSTIQLLTAAADLPFRVRNDLPWPVTVRLTVIPTDLRLDVEPVTIAEVPANSSTRVKVPVSARVGSGELSLRLSLSSPTGVPIGGTESVRVAVRAEWETIGLAVFGGLIVLLIGLGVWRTVRRRRNEANESAADADAAAVPDAVEEDVVNTAPDAASTEKPNE
ncbi:DUF6049 family protein [Microbacterium saperdae]|uniref:2-oxoglutarate dehydrogenase n=1 Tax=Microbacterium saperdae TaxID=69368 RepID=A0A543BAE9_9MICO|nr:DUF6049 family protein [Microbacterium saperdae]TQL81817.1 hypothetical protein FB560_3293 [Microbacterium saperdae]GGM35015.1 hypothetical protein GCM10010489_02280 [Microbacterium saperdae]